MNNKRVYFVEVILYLDNDLHMNFLYDIIKKYDYAYILHDKDLNEDKTDKKPHFHLLLFFNNARYINSIFKEFNLDNNNLIEFAKKDKVHTIRYLIHCDNNEKFQYSIEDIHTNLDLSNYFINKTNETNDIMIIFEFIQNFKGNLSMQVLFKFVIDNNLWSSYRRNYSIIKDLIVELKSIDN